MPTKRRDGSLAKPCIIRSFFWAFHWVEKLILTILLTSLIPFILLFMFAPNHITLFSIVALILTIQLALCRPMRFKPHSEPNALYFAKSLIQPFTLAENAVRHHRKCLEIVSNETFTTQRQIYQAISYLHEDELPRKLCPEFDTGPNE
ncbi:hypothetical protein ACP3V3_01835 [Vibrio sp. PNB22_3_1]